MSDSLTRLRDELSGEILDLTSQKVRLQDQIDEKRRMIARIDQIAEEAPANPVPTATRQPRRDLQALVLAQITSHPCSIEAVRSRVETAMGVGPVTESTVKRVLDALVKKGEIRADGNAYWLPVPVTGEQKAAE